MKAIPGGQKNNGAFGGTTPTGSVKRTVHKGVDWTDQQEMLTWELNISFTVWRMMDRTEQYKVHFI